MAGTFRLVPSTWRSERRGDNLRLSDRMKTVLSASVDSGRIRTATVGTLRALAGRGLCDSDGEVNPFGRVTAVSLLPLSRQCIVLGLPLEEHQYSWNGEPEQAALALLSSNIQWGFADEGRMLHALIHALVLPRLYSTACAAWNDLERVRAWLYRYYAGYSQLLRFDPGLADGMLQDIDRWDKKSFVKSWQTLGAWNATFRLHPAANVEVEEALAVLDAVGRSTLSAIAARVFTDPYAYYRGWPDLMVLDSTGNLRFVEVKTTDRLYYGQIITMSDMRLTAGLDITVMRLKRF
jgi:hypothetical protein